jgi:acyl-CoA synthetase (AMP-forming)/AMP-acid ligase II
MLCSSADRASISVFGKTASKPGVSAGDLEQRLRTLCRTDLAGYKQPRRFEFRAEMPLGPAGKILKRVLKDEYGSPQSTS